MTTTKQIDLWRASFSEHQHLEFKEAKTQFDNVKLYKYCVALANEGGGKLLLGIADKPPRPVVGTAAFNNPLGMVKKLFKILQFRVDIEEVLHPDGRVLVFHIPSRPKGTAYHYKGAYLMRSGDELVPMSEDQLRCIFSEGKPNWLDEPSKIGLRAEEVIDFLDTQAFFDLMNLPYPSKRKRVIERLLQERLLDVEGSKYVIRRLGALLLAKRLNDFPEVLQKVPRVVVYPGYSKLETRLDQIGTKGYAIGFQGLVDFIMSQLPQNEVIEHAMRKEVKLVPEVAIRELAANALIHQDFNINGASVMIEVYSNRIEFSNPGKPIVPVERFIDGYQSRNERLADFMRRFGICEERSSGIDKVIHAAEIYQLPAPDFRTGYLRTIAILYGSKAFNDMDRKDRIRACYQHCALKWVMSEHMTNLSLRERFNLPESKSAIISQIISASIEEGAIKPDEKVGTSRRFARYLPFWA